MRVLLVHNYYQQPGGEDTVFRQEAELLKRYGHTVIRYERHNDEVDTSSLLSSFHTAMETSWSRQSYDEVTKLLVDHSPDIVHVHNWFTRISPSVFWACHAAGVPVVQTLHNYRLICSQGVCYRDGKVCMDCVDSGLRQGVRHGCYRGSRAATAAVAFTLARHRKLNTWTTPITCYIALTEFARNNFIRGGLPASKIFIKPNFLNTDPGYSRGPGDYALFVGLLAEGKGVFTLLEAWQHLESPVPLRIVGDGPMYSQLKRIIADRQMSNVTLLGKLPHSEVIKEMKGASFLVFPAKWWEQFPMTIVEAYACGLPVIAAYTSALSPTVNERTGIFYQHSDARDLARVVEFAWHSREHMSKLGLQARREFETLYTADVNYPILMNIYNHALGRGTQQVVAA